MPLILKVNGKTDIPPSGDALSTLNASVEDAVRLGADAVGYTLYVGSPRQDQDLLQLKGVREDCERFGMPLVIWSYPRGDAVAGKGGQNSFYAIDYAARMAMEMGADIVKLNMPKIDPDKDKDSPAPYNEGGFSQEDAIAHCVESAGRALVVLSGGSKIDDDELLGQTRVDHAGGRLRRDLRAQRLAARVERGGRDRRADQGDHALAASPASPRRRERGVAPGSRASGRDRAAARPARDPARRRR